MTDREAIRQILTELLENEVGEKFADLGDAKNLRSELGLDSVDLVSVIAQIERRFHTRLSRDDMEKLLTVGDVLDLLQVKLGNKSAAA
jgi:acyl carrier protein